MSSLLAGHREPLLSPLEKQHYQRLKVNRIAFIQELRADDIIDTLRNTGVLNHSDVEFIFATDSIHKRTKRLLDILPTKGRSTQWYQHFRTALLNPSVEDSEIRHRYQILVEFLDNTIVEQMKHSVRASARGKPGAKSACRSGVLYKYNPLPAITDNAPAITGNVSQPPTNSHYAKQTQSELQLTKNLSENSGGSGDGKLTNTGDTKIKFPQQKIAALINSNHSAAVALGKQQRAIAAKMLQIEQFYLTWKQNKQSKLVDLCSSDIIQGMITSSDDHHHYFRYLHQLKTDYEIDIANDIQNSFTKLCQIDGAPSGAPSEMLTKDYLINFGLCLSDFLSEFGYSAQAEETLSALVKYLESDKSYEKSLPIFNVTVKAMVLCNSQKASSKTGYYQTTAEYYRDQVMKVSFGQDVLKLGEFYLQLSIKLRELGEYGLAYTTGQKALQEISTGNPDLAVRVLCNSSEVYGNQWNIPRADNLAVQAVQQARHAFGVYHPVYLKALLNYVHFSNEHKQDDFGIKAATAALQISEEIYGYDNLQVAQATEALAGAIMVTTQQTIQYTEKAEKAYEIAVNVLPVRHPLLCSFRHTLGLALLRQAQETDDVELKSNSVQWAAGEANTMLEDAEKYFGKNSPKSAEAIDLLGYINIFLNKLPQAAEHFNDAHQRLLCCINPRHGSIFMIRAALSTIAGLQGDKEKQTEMLKDIVDNFDTNMYYISWYDHACKKLITNLDELGDKEQASDYNSKYLAWKWMSEDNRRVVDWRELHTHSGSIEDFVQEFDVWSKPINLVKEELGKQRNYIEEAN